LAQQFPAIVAGRFREQNAGLLCTLCANKWVSGFSYLHRYRKMGLQSFAEMFQDNSERFHPINLEEQSFEPASLPRALLLRNSALNN
jgi:hypothetical protein